jgi:glycosyltransferase involved in cell wall biosynthesis
MKPLCVISCPIDTFSGYGARSRDLVKALIEKKEEEWDIKILPQRWGETPWNFLSEEDPLRDRFINQMNEPPDIWVQVTIPNEFQPVAKSLNIGVTAGIETTVFPQDFIEGMNRMNLNLVSSNHSKKVALSSVYERIDNKTNQKVGELKLEKPCEVLFEGLDLNKYFKIQKPKPSSILSDISEEFCFLFIGGWLPGNFGEDRKNIATLIKAFLQTFNNTSTKKPALILKTNQVDYSLLDKENLIRQINKIKSQVSGNLPNIYLIHGELTDEEINQLNNDPKVKAFVSFTKGEGFGRPLLEQAITGKPVITTNWSGHIDFIKPEYNILIGGELKNVHPSAANKWLLKESQWFNLNTNIASRAMKDIFKHYKKYHQNSRKQTQYLKENFTLDKMGDKLNTFLPKIEASPRTQKLNLPKLKKVNNNGIKTPELKLPKLKKIEI